ncbi:MAG TPA: 5'-nucleotidase [Chitinophagaceae bacterium]|nr:5'-nucleotidase [Chitinophagaceae bacterium]HPH31827.1 5'-nucleotidase [Chitinophagaceae bacterium]HPN59034.1 5'-nucleotidase [Chitinophagaceae bacterium]
MNPRYYFFPALLLFLTGISCHTSYEGQSLQYKGYRISQTMPADTAVLHFLQPFSDSVNNSMNSVLGVTSESMEKAQPESSLGNFMADAFLIMAREKYQTQVDLAFVNFGGIRLTQLPAGNITRGKVFELMPFDNLLILQKIKGSVLQQVLDLMAGRGGWPVAGIRMQISNNKAVNVQVGGQPLDPEKVYTIANSDFIANGGDNADMLRPVPQITNGYLMRDAIIDYIAWLNSNGKKITATIENRVTHAQ